VSRLALRAFVADDDAALIGWIASAEELERFAGPTLAWPLTADQLEALRADPRVHAWTAYTDPVARAAVGHVEVVRVAAGTGRLARVLLAPARRGEGLGAPHVAAATAYAAALGMTRLELNVFADNAAAIRAYRRLGFADAGEHQADPRVHTYVLTSCSR
jgi:RimJ/RimL family protein N-acetyltransferase